MDSSVEEQPPGTHTVCSVQNMYVCVYVCVCVCVCSQLESHLLGSLGWREVSLLPQHIHLFFHRLLGGTGKGRGAEQVLWVEGRPLPFYRQSGHHHLVSLCTCLSLPCRSTSYAHSKPAKYLSIRAQGYNCSVCILQCSRQFGE